MEKLKTGRGELFKPYNADESRYFFKKKNKKLVNKLTTVPEAVEKYIPDGTYIAVGGFGGVRISTSVLHEILRQGKKNLGLSGHTSTHDCQILAAGECFDRCDIAYVIGLEARGLSRVARKYFESGKVKFTEWTNAALAWRYKAAAMGVSYLPCRTMLGTDTFEQSAAKEVLCPFTGAKYAAVPALSPDVAMIHVHRCDVYGNCQIDGINISDADIAKASKHVIITTERIVPNEEIRRQPWATTIPAWCVDAIIQVPYGSFPGCMEKEYFSDEDHFALWLKKEKDPEEFKTFIKKYILDTKNFSEYLDLCGGTSRMNDLRFDELMVNPNTQ